MPPPTSTSRTPAASKKTTCRRTSRPTAPSICGAATLRVNAGVRYIKTEHDLIGFIRIPSTPPAASNLFGLRKERIWPQHHRGRIFRNAALAQPRLRLVSDLVLVRFSVSQAMTRPNPADLQPFTTISTSGVVSQGNPRPRSVPRRSARRRRRMVFLRRRGARRQPVLQGDHRLRDAAEHAAAVPQRRHRARYHHRSDHPRAAAAMASTPSCCSTRR